MRLCRWWVQKERLCLLLYPGRGPNNPSHPASSVCCFTARYRHNQLRCVRKKGCYALQHQSTPPSYPPKHSVLPGCSLFFAQKGPDGALVWRECRPEQLQTDTHLSPGSPECLTVLYACACSSPSCAAYMPKKAPQAVCLVPAVSCTSVVVLAHHLCPP